MGIEHLITYTRKHSGHRGKKCRPNVEKTAISTKGRKSEILVASLKCSDVFHQMRNVTTEETNSGSTLEEKCLSKEANCHTLEQLQAKFNTCQLTYCQPSVTRERVSSTCAITRIAHNLNYALSPNNSISTAYILCMCLSFTRRHGPFVATRHAHSSRYCKLLATVWKEVPLT